jgi:hypothetical protein
MSEHWLSYGHAYDRACFESKQTVPVSEFRSDGRVPMKHQAFEGSVARTEPQKSHPSPLAARTNRK